MQLFEEGFFALRHKIVISKAGKKAILQRIEQQRTKRSPVRAGKRTAGQYDQLGSVEIDEEHITELKSGGKLVDRDRKMLAVIGGLHRHAAFGKGDRHLFKKRIGRILGIF